jgi:SLT domain-containing protein
MLGPTPSLCNKKYGKNTGLADMIQTNKMQPTNPNAHAYVNGGDVEANGYAVTQNTFLQ